MLFTTPEICMCKLADYVCDNQAKNITKGISCNTSSNYNIKLSLVKAFSVTQKALITRHNKANIFYYLLIEGGAKVSFLVGF